MTLVLPLTTAQLVRGTPVSQRHPGLQLDKFTPPGDQSVQKAGLSEVCRTTGDGGLLEILRARRQESLSALPGVCMFGCATTSPLALHLARASALENAGICLHPLYGFAYLPGSGLKGMARAYAETIWLPGQSDRRLAWRQIEDVFGWAPSPDRREQIKDPSHPAEVRRHDPSDPAPPEIAASCGGIVFHDAWPTSWPELLVDIVNNHHPDYYQAKPDDDAHPPGDWENPVPVYFLAVKPDATFDFVLSKRRASVSDELLQLAQEWLLGALCHLGAGAKTNAGYGCFRPAGGHEIAAGGLVQAVEASWSAATRGAKHRAVFETALELITPAFLAGANQQADDCDLRPATLRGVLRWWWRTMHAGFVDVKTLRALEAAIWGDTYSGGAVRIVLEKQGDLKVQRYDKRVKAYFDERQKQSDYGIPNEDPRKVTQGLWYASYGMDETSRGQRKQRWYVEPGARWRLRLVARPTAFLRNRKDLQDSGKARSAQRIPAEDVLEQAKAALWLLCQYGGVGSKAGKGFGSLSARGFEQWNIEACRRCAGQLRERLDLTGAFEERRLHSSSLERALGPEEVSFGAGWQDIWAVLDQIGFAYQAIAKKYRHDRIKMALGLPRRIGPPQRGAFRPLPPVSANGRHSSPVHIHLSLANGCPIVRVLAFAASHLPDLQTSSAFLKEFVEDFTSDLRRRGNLPPPEGPSRRVAAAPAGPAASSAPLGASTLPRAGEWVQAELLAEKTKKGGWKARHVATGIAGPIQNSADVPADKKPGDQVVLIVQSATQREIAFRYPTAADDSRSKKPQGRPKGGPGRPGPRGGR